MNFEIYKVLGHKYKNMPFKLAIDFYNYMFGFKYKTQYTNESYALDDNLYRQYVFLIINI